MKTFIALTLLFIAVGCGRDKSLDVYQPQQEFEKVTAASNEIPDIKVTPKVDILFVIDDSWSMREEIANLSRNIPRFVEAFTEYQQLDFQIGVTTIWDSIRYQDPALNPNAPVSQFTEVTLDDGTVVQRRNFWSQGELLPLVINKSDDGLSDTLSEGERYITATTENLDQVLINTLLIRPVEHVPGWKEGANNTIYEAGSGQGPEFEELFSPVKQAFSSPLLNNLQSGPNKGFSRNGAHKVVVFLTDADDESQNLTASQLDRFLRQLTNDNSRSGFSTHAVMFRNEDFGKKHDVKCDFDPGLKDKSKKFIGADKLNEFMSITQGTSLSICDADFGDELAKMGQNIVDQALGNIVIPLERYPQYIQPLEGESPTQWLKVFYGEEEIPLLQNLKASEDDEDEWYGWSWDFERNTIIIRGANRLDPVAGGEFQIRFTAVDMKNNRNGGVEPTYK